MITRNLLYTILLAVLYVVMYIAVPAVSLFPLVKKHELGFRVLFYQIAGLCYVSYASFALCFLKIYSCFTSWIAFVLFPILFRIFISRADVKKVCKTWYENQKIQRTLQIGFKFKFRKARIVFCNDIRSFFKNYVIPNFLSVASLVLIVYMVSRDLGYFHLHNYTYTCSDEPTHIYWITCMFKGNPFPAGLYPHGMHFVVAEFCSMFNLDIYRAWMSFGIVAISVILFSAFLCIKKIYSCRYIGLIALALYFFMGVFPNGEWYRRGQEVLPMEFAIFAFFVTIYGMISWIKDPKITSLIMLGMGIVGTTLIHFFVTLFTAFVVIAFVIIFHGVMVRRKSLYKLVICGIATVVFAVLPYATGMVLGYSLEQSFSWGASTVSTGGESRYLINQAASSTSTTSTTSTTSRESTESTESTDSTDSTSSTSSTDSTESTTSSSSSSSSSYAGPTVGDSEIEDPVIENASIDEQITEANSLAEYAKIADGIISKYLTDSTVGSIILLGCCLFTLIYGLLGMLFRRHTSRYIDSMILVFISLSWLITFFALYVSYFVGWLSLMLPTRSSEFIAMMSLLYLGAPAKIIYDVFVCLRANPKLVDSVFTAILLTAIGMAGYEGYGSRLDNFYCVFVNNDLDMKAEEQIISNNEDYTWTYVGVTNARMAVLNYGYHYEIIDLLLNNIDEEEFYIPTQDIYFCLEKQVPVYNSMPSGGTIADVDVLSISAEYASVPFRDALLIQDGNVNSETYQHAELKVIIMSHFYYWLERFKEIYPNEITVYLEDDSCVVYHVKQDPYFLLNMILDYSDLVDQDLQLAAQ